MDKETNKLSANSSWRGRSSGSTLINSFQFMLGGILNSFRLSAPTTKQVDFSIFKEKKMALQCLHDHSNSLGVDKELWLLNLQNRGTGKEPRELVHLAQTTR